MTRPPRPIARFLAVATAIALVLTGLWSTGAAAPMVHLAADSPGANGSMGHRLISIENRGALPLRVTGIGWEDDALAETRAVVVNLPLGDLPGAAELALALRDAPPFEPFDLPGGEARTVAIVGRAHCPLPGPEVTVRIAQVRISAKPVLGPERQLASGGGEPGQAQVPCPART